MATNLVKLICSDFKTFEVDVAVAMESETVKIIMEAFSKQGIHWPIPLPPQVSSKTMAKVMEYCKYHVESRKTNEDRPATPEDEIKAWDADFGEVDRETLRNLIQAAKDLEINNLLKLTAQTLFDIFRQDFRAKEVFNMSNLMFNIEIDFCRELEAEFRRNFGDNGN